MESEEKLTAYCLKCRSKKDITNSTDITMKNGRPAKQGICGDCGTKVFRVMPLAKAS
jgi:hypothetical protein